MIKYLLDTNICIYMIKNGNETGIARHFDQCEFGEIAISAVTLAELSCGFTKHNDAEQMMSILGNIILKDFDADAANVFGQLWQKHPNRKNNIDRMVAAHAISLNAILVTNNTADFAVYEDSGLRLENWTS
ncbi:ribonuclease VapC [Betaproteobacteria bacterium]|nr:ribonuclease VapC [Betaproteobacteria bacterium]